MALIDSNIIVAEKLERKLIRSVGDIQKDVYQMVLRLLLQFKTADGHFVPDADTVALIDLLNKELSKIIGQVDLKSEITDFIDNFDQMDKNIQAVQKSLNGIRIDRAIFSDQKQWAIDKTANTLLEANISRDFIQPVKDILYSRVSFGASVVDAEKSLRLLVLGNPQKFGALERWAGQVARDTINGYQGTVNQQIKVQYELTNIRYVGPLVRDSRPQCVRWITELDGKISDAMLQSEIEWAYKNGKGMMPDTIPENFCQNRGGYNCIHEAVPVK